MEACQYDFHAQGILRGVGEFFRQFFAPDFRKLPDLRTCAAEQCGVRTAETELPQILFRSEIDPPLNGVPDQKIDRPRQRQNPEQPDRKRPSRKLNENLHQKKQKNRTEKQQCVAIGLETVSHVPAKRTVRNGIGEMLFQHPVHQRRARGVTELV